MAGNGAFNFLVIDDFMPAPFVGGLLAYTLAQQSSFISSQVKRYGEAQTLGDERASRICSQGLGPSNRPSAARSMPSCLGFFKLWAYSPLP